jgi:hypothetical protein
MEPENVEVDPVKIVENIKVRVSELEQQIENEKIEFLRMTEKYNKTLNMKYSARALRATNKISKIERKIESYKRVGAKYENTVFDNSSH